MNTVIAAAIVGIAIVIAGREIARHQGSHSEMLASATTIANMAVTLMAARLMDKEYIARVEKLRAEDESGRECYPGGPGSPQRVEWEIGREMLKKIDYAEAVVQKEWVEVAEALYWRSFWKTRDAWQANFNR